MKMKRYFAADARQAIRELREEQGPDAVIISNRRVKGGVEIIAALDYEDALVNQSLGNPYSGSGAVTELDVEHELEQQQMEHASNATADDVTPAAARASAHTDAGSAADAVAVPGSTLGLIQNELRGLRTIMEAPMMQFAWGEMERVQPLQAGLMKQLLTLGLSAALAEKIINIVAEKGLTRHGWLESLKLLASMIPVADDDVIAQGGVVSLVGPTGVGKTTTIAKLAARYALRHGRRNIALVTTDSFRIGAHEQLRTYGRILGVPVQIANDCDELRAVLNHNREKKLTLIDTAGVSQRDIRLSEQLATLDTGDITIRNYLVLSATSQMSLQEDIIQAFSKGGLCGCMLTKIDEASSLGEALSVLVQNDLPVAYISDGQKVPDNLHLARGKQLVKEAVTLMQKMRNAPTQEQLAYRYGEIANNEYI
jgi:flagellar biosynthesis protein FlhF